ncbi:xanthine dehydrogenase family protein subunit M [Labrenzia sp. DG1229]|uniref:FAD binding domain-containing protein n=1 Tax=Labrenzia sp. DG1229 TaxID=681847 RepID=UPI000491880C|nr:xanthine dehydrogenase family protein subunit M [Labrenzia sp. DG1229]
MKPPAFDYLRAESIAGALSAFQEKDGDAVYLAGGHSVVPSLNLRLQAPSSLIDISAIDTLSGISRHDGWLRIGAMTRHVDVLKNPEIGKHAPLFQAAAPHVAHPAIRNRGTIGGSLSLADPASEFPAVALALRAEMEVVNPQGLRRVPADDFFIDIFETDMESGEILQAVWIPPVQAGQVHAFDELARRQGDYAMVGVAISGILLAGILSEIRIAFLSVGNKPTRAVAAEAALIGLPVNAAAIAVAQEELEKDLDPPEDPQLPPAARKHMARVLLGRTLTTLGASA